MAKTINTNNEQPNAKCFAILCQNGPVVYCEWWMTDRTTLFDSFSLIFVSLFKNNFIEINADTENVEPLDIVEKLIVCRKNVRK